VYSVSVHIFSRERPREEVGILGLSPEIILPTWQRKDDPHDNLSTQQVTHLSLTLWTKNREGICHFMGKAVDLDFVWPILALALGLSF
jgi:hypothetical protein